MIAAISNAYPTQAGYKVDIMCQGDAKGYEFASKKDATRQRAKAIKGLKRDGFSVMCFKNSSDT